MPRLDARHAVHAAHASRVGAAAAVVAARMPWQRPQPAKQPIST